MKHKTAELTGDLLDRAVSMALGQSNMWRYGGPSRDWADGGPIIEREGIELACIDRNGRRMGEWQARVRPPRIVHGPTPLVAAMRAFVANKLGEEVELP